MKIKRKFKSMPREKRLGFLRNQIKRTMSDHSVPGTWVHMDRNNRIRRGFQYSKGRVFPLNGDQCWVCGEAEATLRHHIVPVMNGGRNKTNNVVPLCHPCHQRVHKAKKAAVTVIPKKSEVQKIAEWFEKNIDRP